jgi:protein-disulfide isomerase
MTCRLALLPVIALAACTVTTTRGSISAGPITPGEAPPTPAPGPSRAAELEPLSFTAAGLVPIAADDPVWGGADATVTIVAFLDYECPYCAEGWGVLGEIGARYGRDVRIAFKQLPLASHQQSYPSALAAVAVRGLAGTAAFRRFSDLMFHHPDALSDPQREKWAAEVGVDAARYRSALEDPRYGQQVLRDVRLADAIGITGTPAFVVNGLLVAGAAPIDDFSAIIEAELPEALAMQRRGLPPALVYEERVKVNAEAGE